MSVNNTNSFEPSYDTCKAISDQCPVSATLYGDYFSTIACIFFTISFAVLLVIQLYYLIKSRAWSYATYLGIGTAFELVGYFSRKMLSDNPWQFMPFVLQLFLLMLAPTFIAAAISVTFKHLVIYYGSQWSPIRPRWYPCIFVGSDVISILIQAVGCAFAAMASSGDKKDAKMSDISSAMLILGVTFQLVNMMVCGGLMLPYYHQQSKGTKSHGYGTIQSSGMLAEGPKSFLGYNGLQVFVWSISIAFVAIIIRCIYRIPEMATGWGSDLMKAEITFLIFDGAMVLVAIFLVTVFHPANYFPKLSKKGRNKEMCQSAIPLRDNACSTVP
ncbi:RTA1 like protein-domain-containing protein [Fusarium oxysporum]|uniref:Sphingoid long-chain base transporter RSB1 n=1 Tax=Fusarium oxysporum TaxID=5507 RepID=A0A420NEM0_FUSOX|nr:RTA1 like protein-domain-containing protein [Fusarium oxysporum]RKK78716.1 hypothetical protein BFJ69_g5468 [Fusarium oxysporum]